MKESNKTSAIQQIAMVIAFMVIVYTFFEIIVGKSGFVDLKMLKNEKQSIISTNSELRRNNMDIAREIDRLKSDPKYIEVIARQELGLIGKNEIVVNMSNEGWTKK